MKDIPGYEGLYAVTTDGRVWSYPKKWAGHEHQGMWLTPASVGSYPGVTLHRRINGKLYSKSYALHRLVALAYIPNPENKPHVNHKDFDKTNPRADNLEWSTRSENTIYSAKVGQFSRFIARKYTNEQIKKVHELDGRGMTRADIGRLLNMPPTTVSAICRGTMRATDNDESRLRRAAGIIAETNPRNPETWDFVQVSLRINGRIYSDSMPLSLDSIIDESFIRAAVEAIIQGGSRNGCELAGLFSRDSPMMKAINKRNKKETK